MKSEFKVLPWLRTIRDENARKVEPVPPGQRNRLLLEESQRAAREFLKANPDAGVLRSPAPMLREDRPPYGESES